MKLSSINLHLMCVAHHNFEDKDSKFCALLICADIILICL